MIDRIRHQWEKFWPAVGLALLLLLAVVLGWSACAMVTQSAVMTLIKAHQDERQFLIQQRVDELAGVRARFPEYLTIISRQSDQLAQCGVKSSENVDKAIQSLKGEIR